MNKTEKWITKARMVHGCRFDYSKVDYITQDNAVVVGCPEHGEFSVTPRIHIRKSSAAGGCKTCASIAKREGRLSNTAEFIRKAKGVHPHGLDDYSKVEYIDSKTDILLRCVKHDLEYRIRPGNHLNRKQRCQQCASEKHSRSYVMSEAERGEIIEGVFPDHFDWSGIGQGNRTTTIQIRCKKHNRLVNTKLSYLVSEKMPCEECVSEKHQSYCDTVKLSWEQFLHDAKITHDNKYEYIEIGDFDLQKEITIRCPDHGEFIQLAAIHRSGRGCKRCGIDRAAAIKRRSTEDFIAAARDIHGDRYDYSVVDYRNNSFKVKIGCPEHGWFWQSPYNHLSGYGCGACTIGSSKGELEMADHIKGMGFEVIHRYKLDGVEYDIAVLEKNLLIEYCGNYWHSELNGKDRKYHLRKLKHAEDNGYRLLTIYEDEWRSKLHIVKNRLNHICGNSVRGVGARKLNIAQIEYGESRDFLNQYHIQGSTKQMKYSYGGFLGDKLVAVMAFNPSRKSLGGRGSDMELVRFSTDGYNYPGVASRLLSHYRKHHADQTIISYADRRWSTGEVYYTLGFSQTNISPPSYWYMDRKNYQRRYHRFGFRKAFVVERFDADPVNTEWEIMQNNGYDRIWDCGSIKFVLQ